MDVWQRHLDDDECIDEADLPGRDAVCAGCVRDECADEAYAHSIAQNSCSTGSGLFDRSAVCCVPCVTVRRCGFTNPGTRAMCLAPRAASA